MPVASTKKSSACIELAAAHAQAEAACARQNEAIARAEAMLQQLDIEEAEAEAIVPKKDREDVRRMATEIKNESKPIAAWAGRDARLHVAGIKERRALTEQAVAQLRDDLVLLEIDKASKKNAYLVARIEEVLAPLIAARVEKIRTLRVELLKERVMLSVLLADKDPPVFPNDFRAFFKAREAEQARTKARQMACGELRREAETDAAYLAVMPAAHTTEEYSMVLEVAAQWTRELARLFDDPTAEPEKK